MIRKYQFIYYDIFHIKIISSAFIINLSRLNAARSQNSILLKNVEVPTNEMIVIDMRHL